MIESGTMDCNNVLSIIGSVITIIGFPITIWQLIQVKSIANKTQKEINRVDTFGNIAKCNQIIKEVSTCLKQNHIEQALTKLRDVKDLFVQIKVFISDCGFDEVQLDGIKYNAEVHLGKIQKSINDIEKNHNTPDLLNIGYLAENFDNLSTFIMELQAQISNRLSH